MNRPNNNEIGMEVRVEIRPAGVEEDSRLAHHVTSIHSAPFPLSSPRFPLVRVTTDGAHAGTTHPAGPAQPISVRRDIWGIGDSLGERDWAILRSVSEHRFLTVSQIHTLHFGELTPVSGLRIAQRVLVRLRNLRLLGTLERQVGGVRAGSSGLVHFLDANGERLLRAESGQRMRRHMTDPSETFLKHTLAVSSASVALVTAHRAGKLELLTSQVEPAAWRRYVGIGGARLTLKPDLYADTAESSNSDYLDSWFIEIDLGTESIPRLIKKCRDYEAYRRSGIEQDKNEGTFPRIVWSMTAKDPAKAERRRVALREAIDRDRNLPSELFFVITPDELIGLMQEAGNL
ncbi:replication-relaxation family protein [Nocardia sp. NPDC051052]|uniref:replication-relaxation family protein n=1 Tax=Nocardia sp. NPDC051052 TaxID=3364322 RepID=UPI0037BCA3D1